MNVDITLLGGFSVRVGGVVVNPTEWRRRQAAALVKVLALQPRRRLHREQVIDMLWPELGVQEGAPRLHKAAHYARRALGGQGTVTFASESVSLFQHHDVRVDALQFEALAAAATAAQDAGSAGRAADSYGGPLLPDDLYEPWAQDHRQRLHMIYLDTLRLAGRWDVLTTVDPTDENAHLRVITALAHRGERRAALRQFDRLERVLQEQLGVAPSRRALDLRARFLLPSTTTERKSAVGRPVPTLARGDDHRPVPSPPETRRPRAVAPAAPPSPAGRGAERERVDQLLRDLSAGPGRTVFVTGPAGAGKTALLAWLERAAAARGMRVGSGAAVPIEGGWPFAPVLEAIADMSRRHPTLLDGLADHSRAEIRSRLAGWEPGGTAVGHQRLFFALTEFVRRAAVGAGAVIVVDDAHRADDASLRLLHYLARSTVLDRAMFVVAHRPSNATALSDVRRSLTGRGSAVTIDLKPQSYEEVPVLVPRLRPGAGSAAVHPASIASAGLPSSRWSRRRARATSDPSGCARAQRPPRAPIAEPTSAAHSLGT
jgi:DNA-binding SARP family transcriptional activator